jgi:hypothetical protein
MSLWRFLLWWLNTIILGLATAGIVGVIAYVVVTWFLVAVRGEL